MNRNDYLVKTMLCKTPSPYFIVLACSVKHRRLRLLSFTENRPILQVDLPEAPYLYFAGGYECVIFIDYDSSVRNTVAEANTSADTRNSANTVSILGHNLDSWHNIEVDPLCLANAARIYTEALKQNDKNIFYFVIMSYKSLNRLLLSRYNDLVYLCC